MNISLSNMMATGVWTAFLSVLAIIGIVVAGGFIVAMIGKMMLSVFNPKKDDLTATNVDEFGYVQANNAQNTYIPQHEEMLQANASNANRPQVNPEDDYAYALDVDDAKAKLEEDALNKELDSADTDDFFKDFTGDDDVRFGDDDLLGLVDEISQDVLDEEEQTTMEAEQAESAANQSILDQYSIDNYLDEEEVEPIDEDMYAEEELEEFDEQPVETDEIVEDVTEIEDVVDEATMEEINALKQQVKEIVESMEDNRNQNETFNEQLINILNELKESNNRREIETQEDAEREIYELRQQLEASKLEMEQQLQAKIADKDAEMQMRLQEQLDFSNAEIDSLKAQLSTLLQKLEEPEAPQEVEPVEELDNISMLRSEVKEMLEAIREENQVKNNEFNSQLIDILNEMKEATLNQSKKLEIETAAEAVEEVESWKEELEVTERELQRQFREEMLHKSEEEKAELRAQMETYNAEIVGLKSQLNELIDRFKEQSDNSKAENKALLDQLEAERQERIYIEKEKMEIEQARQAELERLLQEKTQIEQVQQEQLEALRQQNIELEQARQAEIAKLAQERAAFEQAQQEQLEKLRKENEELADKLYSQAQEKYEPLSKDEMDDLYSEATNIDYSAISQMNEEQIEKRVQAGLETSKQEIEELKEQISRLTDYIEKREGGLADQVNVHEVKAADIDIEQIKEVTANEVEARVKDKLFDSLAEIQILKEELIKTREEISKQYKAQLANTRAGMEYDRVSKLQASAEKVDSLDSQLTELTENIYEEQGNIKETSEECVNELESLREAKTEEVKQSGLEDSEVAVIGPKNNKVALITTDDAIVTTVENIDAEAVKRLSNAEIDEIIDARLKQSTAEIENLKNEIAQLKKDLSEKDEQIANSQATGVPVVRSPLFDVELIKTITAKEVEQKVQERLAEAMKEIQEMKQQLEASKREIEKQYREQVLNNKSPESEEVKDRLKDSAAEVIELKEQLTDLTEQITLDHQEARANSDVIVEQLEQDRKANEEMAKQQLTFGQDSTTALAITTAEVTVIGPKDNQVALISGVETIGDGVDVITEDIPTIDIDTVKKLAEQEIEEKVQQRMASSTIEIEDLKKQILNLSIQIQEIKETPASDDDSKPVVFHYATEEAYVERLAILEERLKNAKKDLKINAKELNPLEKVNRTLERDKIKLRRKYAIAAKKKVALYGVNNYVDIDKEKAEKLKQELELLEGLKLSVSHCEEVMNANIDRYPILVHTNKILKENIAHLESDIATLTKELAALREKNGTGTNN